MKLSLLFALATALFAAACGDGSVPSLGQGAKVPQGVGVDPGRGGIGGAGGSPDGGVDGGIDSGTCGNQEDLVVIAATNLSGVTTSCSGLVCLGFLGDPARYEQCVNACVEQRVPGLSPECAGCYGGLARCGLDAFCLSVCQFNTCGLQCLNCLDFTGCLTEFEACRGIPGSGCSSGGLPSVPATDNQ